MFSLPGFTTMPTTLLNALLGLVPERDRVVRGPDRLAVVAPMFNEEDGARPSLRSLFAQTYPLDEIAISINGGSDRTAEVVAATVAEAGYRRDAMRPVPYLGVTVERWSHPDSGPKVTVVSHALPTSKADGVNFVVEGGYVTAERILVVDGDTRFDPTFVRELRDGFYRLRRVRERGRVRYVLEDVAMQSGAVDSLRPAPGWRPQAHAISRARSCEYALAALLRTGQTRRLARRGVFGATRMYTVVGCGFAARRDTFPMPSRTLTEDHDFTLAVQNGWDTNADVDANTLHVRGFTVVAGGRERSPRDLFDRGDRIILRKTAGTRFMTSAPMFTEDPPTLEGYVRQVERWSGGGIQNALARVVPSGAWRDLRANVRFTVLASQLENLLGLVFLFMLPVALGLHTAAPSIGGIGLIGMGVWIAIDVLATFGLVGVGALRLERPRGRGYGGRALGRAVLGVVPLLLLRLLNVVGLLSGAIRVVPSFFVPESRRPATTSTWVRVRVRGAPGSRRRLALITVALLGLAGGAFEGVRQWAAYTWPDDRRVTRLLRNAPTFDQDEYRQLPISPPGPGNDDTPQEEEPGPEGGLGPARPFAWLAGAVPGIGPGWVLASAGFAQVPSEQPSDDPALSRYCRPAYVSDVESTSRRLGEASEAPYVPLSKWGALTLARLAPLVAHLEEAANAYGVPPELVLQVLLNESYLDPLAVGPTNDLGLSQMTPDTLSLLAALATDPATPFTNPHLFPSAFSVFDPDFSICAGAAMLAWSRSQTGGEDPRIAYARYVNPRHGVVRGNVSDRHRPIVDAFMTLVPMVDAVSATIATYRDDPGAVTPRERALLDVSRDVAAGRTTIETAYRHVAEIVREYDIGDDAFYEDVLSELYGD